jgi:hypothetical protein
MAANPSALIMQLLKSQGAGGGASGATGSPAAQESVGPATRELQGADPGYALKLINDMKKRLLDMLPSLAFKAPAASRALMSSFKGIDTALKELQQAQATLSAVGGPIQNSAIPQPQPPMGGVASPDITRAASNGM